MAIKITLVGCGNIGRRHMEAILKLPYKIILNIIEPNPLSKKNAIRILDKKYEKKKIVWTESIESIKNTSDLTIIATNSDNRVKIIKTLLKKGHKKFLIEKVVCQSISQYQELVKNLQKNNAKCWINFPRRYFYSYQEIKRRFSKNKISQITVIGGDISLGSNSIHFIDLFCWLNNSHNVKLFGRFLDEKILQNKRGKNFVEFSGTILAQCNDSFFSITSLPNSKIPLSVDITFKNNRIIFDETNNKTIMNNTKRKIFFKNEYVSETSSKIIHDIIKNNKCELPTAQNSYFVHKEIFNMFNLHLKKITGKKKTVCPIT